MAKQDQSDVPEFIAKGTLMRQIEQLPGEQRELVLAADQATREKVMVLTGEARMAAIAALANPPAAASTATTKKGE